MKVRVLLILLAIAFTPEALADYLLTNRKIAIKERPSSSAETIIQVESGTALILMDDGAQQNGYYRVTYQDVEGYIFRSFVRRYRGLPEATVATRAPVDAEPPVPADPTLEDTYMPRASQSDQVIRKGGYVSCMSTEFNVPLWVYQKVSQSLLKGPSRQRPSSYPRDPEYPLLKSKAYEGSGYDHGHLAPAADFKREKELYDESFYMTNMAPQHGCFNQKGWCLFESNVRDWPLKNPASEFYIFSGSIIDEHVTDWLCVGDVTVTVPSAFYKVIAERKNGAFVKGVAFILSNGDVDGTELESTRTTIDEVEQITGLNFFPNLSSSVASRVEGREADFPITDLSECSKRNSPCETVYRNRIWPELRTRLLCEFE